MTQKGNFSWITKLNNKSKQVSQQNKRMIFIIPKTNPDSNRGPSNTPWL